MHASELNCSEQTWTLGHHDRFVRSWLAPDSPSSSLQREIVMGVVHGLGDHSGRFDETGRWFASRGVHVYAYDQCGHGKTPGRRMLIPSYESLLQDIDSFLSRLRELHRDASVGFLGPSMGGNLVLNHQLRGYSPMDWVVAASPMLRAVNPPGPIRLALLRLLSHLTPDRLLDKPVDPADISRDPEKQREFLDDPLVQQQVSLRLGRDLIDSGRWAIEHATALSTPTLVPHGDADVITCHRASVEFVENSHGRASMQIWPDGAHDLHQDIQREAYLQSLLDWINAQVADR
ncbi:Phospholipase YtpA [Stieleria maiorica]|uniref:Phospholipase YtpA n=1 Tax=Stieleria maiorica TaxID=2795974 RepID=A0A5B9MCS0_9BACT|nr:alpha/beta fold hydrolase [Stieleria maiorica]QEF97414.1 Phospholipase YtpA [Stieleria maiorica]